MTGGRTDLGGAEVTEVVAPVVAGFGDFVATLRDTCPGGFEGCIAGLQVQRVPGLETITAFTVGEGTEAVAVGAEGRSPGSRARTRRSSIRRATAALTRSSGSTRAVARSSARAEASPHAR